MPYRGKWPSQLGNPGSSRCSTIVSGSTSAVGVLAAAGGIHPDLPRSGQGKSGL